MRRLDWFLVAWSFGTLIHYTKRGNATSPAYDFGTGWSTPTGVIVAAAAALVILFPRRPSLLAFALVAQVVDYWIALPVVATSATFRAIVNVTLLVGMARGAILRRGAWQGALETVGAIRLEYILLWVAAVLHKLNAGFFDPSSTDALKIFTVVPIPIPPVLQPWLTVAYELSIGGALTFRRSRAVGILLAIGFAFQTGFGGIPQFASVSISMALLFVGDEVMDAMPSPVPESWRNRLGRTAARAIVVFPAMAAMMITTIATQPLFLSSMFGWTCLALGIAVSIAIGRRRARPLAVTRLQLGVAPAVVVLIAAGANELGPYVGYKDWPVFSMYSNSGPTECARHYFFGQPPIRTHAGELWEIEDGATIGFSRGSLATEQTLQVRLDAYARMGVRGLVVRAAGPHGERRFEPSSSPFYSAPIGRFFYDFEAYPEERRCFTP